MDSPHEDHKSDAEVARREAYTKLCTADAEANDHREEYEAYAKLCIADAAARLRHWLTSETRSRSREIAEPAMLLCALRIRATKVHYWQTVDQFTKTLDTPLEILAPTADDPLEHRIRRFAELYVLAATRGKYIGWQSHLEGMTALPRYGDLSDVGEAFAKPLATITSLARAMPTKPTTHSTMECTLLFRLFGA